MPLAKKNEVQAGTLVRPNVAAHDNPVMHYFGKAIRTIATTISFLIDRGRFRPHDFRINHLRIGLQELPRDFDNYRIVQISDIHLGTWMNAERLRGVVELVNQQCPDLICITGDFITHEMKDIFNVLKEELCSLKSSDGILAVLGNHDHWSNAPMIRAVLRSCKIQELRNEVIIIHKGNGEIYIAGLDDVYNSKDNLDEVLAQIPPSKKAILLVHVPDFADIAAETNRFSLQLSGHSHGGQIILPKIGSPVLPPLAKKYARGIYKINQMLHYTNSGVGTATIPFRYNCPPEIAVIELFNLDHSDS